MTECWKARAEERPNFDTIYSLIYEIYNKYAAIQGTAPPTTIGLGDINYSTFGKDLRSHDAPPLETAAMSLGGSYPRRTRSTAGSLRGSILRGSPANNSQRNSRNSQNLLSVDSMSVLGDRALSITFSVLSNENDLDQSSDSEAEESRGLNFEIPSFLTGQEETKKDLYPSPMQTGFEHPRAESPMDQVSTFLPSGSRPSRTSHDHADYSPSFLSHSPVVTGAHPSPHPPQTTPTSVCGARRPSCDSVPFGSNQKAEPPGGGGRPCNNEPPTPPPLSGSTSPDMAVPPPAVSITPSNPDTISKPSTPDSIGMSSSGFHPSTTTATQPSSHIPGIPGSTFNNTSVSIDDVKMRNGSLLVANGHTVKSASMVSTTPSGASKSDSGIRSDEEMESVLSNGGALSSSSEARTPMSKKMSFGSSSVGKKDSETSLGIADLSSDLMATFASWGKN